MIFEVFSSLNDSMPFREVKTNPGGVLWKGSAQKGMYYLCLAASPGGAEVEDGVRNNHFQAEPCI